MTDAQLLATLEASVECGESSGAYHWAITFLSAALVLLPLCYCGLIFFVTWVTVRGVTRALTASQSAGLAAATAVVGGVVVLFLIKPLFAFRRRQAAAVRTLSQSSEPLLFEFIHKLCTALGAPTPRQIEVDCMANASARFRNGITSMLADDLVLRIGLPLAAGLTVRQFAGVLAHELGHFSQRGGMRGTYVVRLTNRWFARIVFERDRLDRHLASLRRTPSARVKAGYYLLVWMVESARGLMWLLMIVGELLSNGVLRRMEFDADRYAAHIAGARDFQATARILTLLNVATAGAQKDLQRSWSTQRLADDFPRLIVAKARELPPALRSAVFKVIDERKTRWFDTHPCDSERFEHVRSIEATPMVRCDLPAKRLFSNFAALCRQSSEAEYRNVLQEKFDAASLVPTARLVSERAGERQAFEALQRFYQGQVIASRPILPEDGSDEPLGDAGAAQEVLQQGRDKMVAAAAEMNGAAATFEKRAMTLAVARAKIALASAAGRSRKIGAFRRGAEGEVQKLVAEQNAAILSMMDFEDSAKDRLSTALRLAQVPAITRQLIANGCPKPIQRAEKLRRILDELGASVSAVNSARTFALTVRLLLAAYNPRKPNRGIAERLAATTRELNALLRKICNDLSGTAYPFEHAVGGVSIGASLVDELPAGDAIIPTLISAEILAERFYTLLYRALAGATQLAERVETAVGMAPLADPPPAEADAAAGEGDAAARKKLSRSYWIWYPARAASGLAMLLGLIFLASSDSSIQPLPAHSTEPHAFVAADAAPRFIAPPPVPVAVPPAAPFPANISPADPPPWADAMLKQTKQLQAMHQALPHPAPVRISPPPAMPAAPVAPSLMPLPSPAQRPATPVPSQNPVIVSQRKMRTLQRAILMWRQKHEMQYPDSLQELVASGALPDAASIQTPGDSTVQFGYIKPQPDSPRTAILLYDPSMYGNRPGMAVLISGAMLSLPTPDAMKARVAQDSGKP